MSIQAVAWVLEHSTSTGSARLVLISLANHASERNNWECWPTSRTIAHEAGVKSHSTALDASKALVKLGEISIIDPGDQRNAGRYRLTFMGERSESDHSSGRESTAEVAPGRPLRSPQADQNRNEPEETGSAPPLFDATVLDDEFEMWWKPYPVKKDKAKARRCYHARREEGTSAGALLRARDAYIAAKSDDRDFPKFVKHAATFLAKGSDAPWTEWLDGDPDVVAGEDLGTLQQQLGAAQWMNKGNDDQ